LPFTGDGITLMIAVPKSCGCGRMRRDPATRQERRR
jgi:hypothetical protein